MDAYKIKESAERYVDGNYSYKYSGVQRTAAREGFLAGAKCGYRQAIKDIANQLEEAERKKDDLLHPDCAELRERSLGYLMKKTNEE